MRSVNLQHDFVGLDADQNLALGDGVTGLFLPIEQSRLGDRFGEFGGFDDNHREDFLFGGDTRNKASITSACSRACRLGLPAAGEAADGRKA